MRLYEIFTETLIELVNTVRNQLQINDCTLENRCDIGAENLANLLSQKGISGEIVNGVFIYPDGHEEGHHFIVLDDMTILDPTRSQFDEGPMIFPYLEQNPETHRIDNIVRSF